MKVTKIIPNQSWALELKEILESKQLLFYLIWRNFKIRYKQTLLGAMWAMFKPFILMVVFTFAFNNIGNVEIDKNIPYPVFAYSGLMFWTYFANTVNQVATSLIHFQNIISKIYFPRLLIPVSVAVTGLIDFFFSLIVYFGLLFYFKIPVTLLGLIAIFLVLLITFMTTLGVGLFMAALNIKYRDVQQALPFFVQALLFLTPVVYPVDSVPENLRALMYVNPLTGAMDLVHGLLLGVGDLNPPLIIISAISATVMLLVGLLVFKNREREFADLI